MLLPLDCNAIAYFIGDLVVPSHDILLLQIDRRPIATGLHHIVSNRHNLFASIPQVGGVTNYHGHLCNEYSDDVPHISQGTHGDVAMWSMVF